MTSVTDPTFQAKAEPRPASHVRQQGMSVVRLIAALVLALAPAGFIALSGALTGVSYWLVGYLSLCACIGGIFLLRGRAFGDDPEVEIDTICHEVRLVQPQRRSRIVLRRYRFRDLGQVDHTATHMRLWDSQATLIAEVPVSDVLAHRSLITALRVAGKL
jgi:hypothetical protein